MRYFTVQEFDCSETGTNEMSLAFMAELDILRGVCGFPFVVNSGFRAITHSIEAVKSKPGTHTQGIATDIAITDSTKRSVIVRNAIHRGFTGIGIAKTFIHLDMRGGNGVMWVY